LQSIDDTKLSKEDETNGWGVSDIIPDDYGFFSLSPTYKVHCEKKGKPWSAFKTPHGADARKMALRETPWYQEISVDANLTIQHDDMKTQLDNLRGQYETLQAEFTRVSRNQNAISADCLLLREENRQLRDEKKQWTTAMNATGV